MNEHFGHRVLGEKWKRPFSNLIHSGSPRGISPAPHAQGSAWHINMQYVLAGPSSREKADLRKETQA